MSQTESSTISCPYCKSEIPADALKCRHCGEWIKAEPGRTVDLDRVYDATFDIAQLSGRETEEFKRHNFTSTFPTAAVIALHFVTFGVFTIIYFGLKHAKLPKIGKKDPSAKKAILLFLIPLFNLYWYFAFWLRLVDRVNFQFRLRNLPPPVNRSGVKTLVAIAVALTIINYFLLSADLLAAQFALAGVGLLLLSFNVAWVQGATNRLALETAPPRVAGVADVGGK